LQPPSPSTPAHSASGSSFPPARRCVSHAEPTLFPLLPLRRVGGASPPSAASFPSLSRKETFSGVTRLERCPIRCFHAVKLRVAIFVGDLHAAEMRIALPGAPSTGPSAPKAACPLPLASASCPNPAVATTSSRSRGGVGRRAGHLAGAGGGIRPSNSARSSPCSVSQFEHPYQSRVVNCTGTDSSLRRGCSGRGR
jgi:hypothetical protein